MSEYMHTRAKQTPQPQGDTLFDDDTFDKVEHIVNTRGISYADARRIVGVETPSYERPDAKEADPSQGVSIELGARALALHNIMDTYNQLNKTMGARIAVQYVGNSFDTRYPNPDEVIEGMGRKSASMIHSSKADFHTLNAEAELIDAGFDPHQVDLQARRLENELRNEYGPGKAYAPDRQKVVRKAQATAKRVNRANKKTA